MNFAPLSTLWQIALTTGPLPAMENASIAE